MNKVLLIDKEAGWTSFDVVAKLRSAIRIKNLESGIKNKVKVGHAGTLDPFATGLLIVLVGTETKKQDSYMKQDKEYEATLKLGFTSTTGDPEGEITPFKSASNSCHSELISESRNDEILKQVQDDEVFLVVIEKVLRSFLGEISQIPPIYSAIKVDGKRAYKLAREGKVPEMKPRKVTIFKLQILNYKFPKLQILVRCSSGTYIRTLAEDIGKALGCGAYLIALRRTEIGNFSVSEAKNIDNVLADLLRDKLG